MIKQLINDELRDLDLEKFELINQIDNLTTRLAKIKGKIITLLKYGARYE